MLNDKDPMLYLSNVDPVLAIVMRAVGVLKYNNHDGFEILTQSIIHQQLSKAAANSILERLNNVVGRLSLKSIQRVADYELRMCGLAQRKIEFIRSLSTAILNKDLSFRKMHQMSDEEVISTLTRHKGIGPWTANMYLIFSLNRPNVFPDNDAGLMAAMRDVYQLSKHPDIESYRLIAKKWQPYRSLAVRYLWAYHDGDSFKSNKQ